MTFEKPWKVEIEKDHSGRGITVDHRVMGGKELFLKKVATSGDIGSWPTGKRFDGGMLNITSTCKKGNVNGIV